MGISTDEFFQQYKATDETVAPETEPQVEVDAKSFLTQQVKPEVVPPTKTEAALNMLETGAEGFSKMLVSGIRWGAGAVEAVETVATGLAASVVSGWGAIGSSLFGLESMTGMDAAGTQKFIQDSLTYHPRGEEGRKVLETAGLILEPVDDFFKATGEVVMDLSQEVGLSKEISAALGAGTYAGASVLGVPVAAKGIQAGRNIPIIKQVSDTVGTTKDFVGTNVKNLFTTSLNKAARDKSATSTVIREISDTLPENVNINDYISKYERLKEVPGYEPTLPEVLGTDILVGRQRELSQQKRFHEQTVKRQKSNLKAIQDFRNEVLGGSESEGFKIVAKVDGDIKKSSLMISNRIKQYEGAMEHIKKTISESPTTGSKYELGQKFRDLSDKQYKLRKLQGELLYLKVGNPEVPAGSIASKTKELLTADQNLMANMPTSMRKFNTLYQAMQEKAFAGTKPTPSQLQEFDANLTLSFDGLRGLKTAVGEDKAMATQAGNFQTVHHLKNFESSIDEAMNALEKSGDMQTVQAYRTATKYWRDQVAVPHYEGVGALLFKDPRKRGRSIVNEGIADKFLDPKNLEGIKDFKRIYADSPEAVDRLVLSAAYKMDKMAGTKDGLYLDPNKYKQFMNQHWQIFEEMPVLKAELSTIGQANNFLFNQRRRLQNKLDMAQKSEFVKRVQSENIEGLVKSAIEDHTKGFASAKTVLRKVADDADAKLALSHFTVDSMLKKFTIKGDQISYGALSQYMKQNKKSLDMLLTPEHTGKLGRFMEAWDTAATVDIAPARQIRWVGDVAKEKFGQTVPSLVTQWRAISHGRQGVPQAGAQITSLYLHALHKNTLQQLEYAAFYDIPVMETLTKVAKLRNQAEVPVPLQKDMNNHIKRLGIYVIPQELMQQQEQQSE